jgi:hypothetical protein
MMDGKTRGQAAVEADRTPERRHVARDMSDGVLSNGDLSQLEDSLPPFLRPADLQRLYAIGRSEAYLLANQIGAVRFGSKGKLIRVPRSGVLDDLRRRALLRNPN